MVMMCWYGGGAGADALLGGFGDDLYVQYIGYGNGRDTINDGVTASYTLAMAAAMATLCTCPMCCLARFMWHDKPTICGSPVWPMPAMVRSPRGCHHQFLPGRHLHH